MKPGDLLAVMLAGPAVAMSKYDQDLKQFLREQRMPPEIDGFRKYYDSEAEERPVEKFDHTGVVWSLGASFDNDNETDVHEGECCNLLTFRGPKYNFEIQANAFLGAPVWRIEGPGK